MIEKWKSVLDYEGLYEVSNFGRVRSWFDTHGNKREIPLIIGGYENSNGYLQVCLTKNKKKKPLLIHRLVCESFILNRKMKKGEVCDHINTIKTDNRVENLRVCTHYENNNNPLTCKKRSLAQSKPLTLRGVKDGSIYRFKSACDASRFFGYKNERTIITYISRASKNNKRTIKIHDEEFYFSQAVK